MNLNYTFFTFFKLSGYFATFNYLKYVEIIRLENDDEPDSDELPPDLGKRSDKVKFEN